MAADMASAKNTGAPPVERRRHPRAATSLRAELAVGGAHYPGKVINLSMGGALLDFHAAAERPPVAPGERVAIHIECPAIGAMFAAEAKAVLWNARLGPEPLLAIQFDEIDDDAELILEELMAEALVDLTLLPPRRG